MRREREKYLSLMVRTRLRNVCWCAGLPSEVLLIPYERLLLSDGSPAHQRTLRNLVRTISDKYFLLSRRIDLLVLKSLRAKVCAYLLSESERAGSLTFSIPFSRIQLADYLNCGRSALSRELSQMQRDGLLDTYKSSFKLLEMCIRDRSTTGNTKMPPCGARRAQPKVMESAPATAAPATQLGRTRSGSAAA